jgi:PTS system mannose-specific IIA component
LNLDFRRIKMWQWPAAWHRGYAFRALEERMIGVIIVTHANLAKEFVAALEHVVGPQQQIEAISIAPSDNMEERRNAILAAARRVDSGDGTIILTDMFGGTPSNLSISVMDAGSVEVIAGVNLPMLVKLARIREEVGLVDALKEAQEAGRKYIHVASLVLGDH